MNTYIVAVGSFVELTYKIQFLERGILPYIQKFAFNFIIDYV